MPERPKAHGRMAAAAAVSLLLLLVQAPAAAQVDGVARAADGVARDAADRPRALTTPTSAESQQTGRPPPPDHASGSLVELHVLGEEVLVVGETESRVEDDGRARGRATPLRVMGMEFFRSDSDSRGQQEDSDGAAGFCDPFDVACFGALQSESESREEGGTSWSRSTVSLANVCLGPNDSECELLEAEGGFSGSVVVRDRRTGRTTALHVSDLGGLCFALFEECGLFLFGFAFADAPSPTAPGEAARFSCLGFENDEGECLSDEVEECLDSVLCIFLNRGETFLFPGGAAAWQEAFRLTIVIEELVLVDLMLVSAEALARNLGVAEEERPTAPADAAAPALAVTGLHAWRLLGAAAWLIALGAALVLARRREAASRP